MKRLRLEQKNTSRNHNFGKSLFLFDVYEEFSEDYSSYFFTMIVALCPPNPKEFERAVRTVRCWALLKVKLRL